jgi:FkbM family methyltransferase
MQPLNWTGRALRRLGNKCLERSSIKGTWIDVGAHYGEVTLPYANQNPALRIFAFEPNLRAAAALIGRAPNLIVVPMAVAETDGQAEFNINSMDAASSLLPMSEEAREGWIGGASLRVESTVYVPTIRLDTFLNVLQIPSVDLLKIDAQGMDLAVIRSTGDRLRDIVKITLEVDVSQKLLYRGAPSKSEVLDFLTSAGFILVATERQSHGQEENLTFERS